MKIFSMLSIRRRKGGAERLQSEAEVIISWSLYHFLIKVERIIGLVGR
jgi:hypothetical protein